MTGGEVVEVVTGAAVVAEVALSVLRVCESGAADLFAVSTEPVVALSIASEALRVTAAPAAVTVAVAVDAVSVTFFAVDTAVLVTVATVAVTVFATGAVVGATDALVWDALSVALFAADAAVLVAVAVVAAGAVVAATGALAWDAVSVTVGALAALWTVEAGCPRGVPGRPACATSAKAAAQSTAPTTIDRRRTRVRAREITLFLVSDFKAT